MTQVNNHVLIIEKDMETADAIGRFCEALTIPSVLVQTHSNAIRASAAHDIGLTFINPSMNMIDPRALLEDIRNQSQAMHKAPAPVIFLVDQPDLISRLGLKGIPGTAAWTKPVQIERVFLLMQKLSMTELRAGNSSESLQHKIEDWQNFADSAEEWLTKFRSTLVKK